MPWCDRTVLVCLLSGDLYQAKVTLCVEKIPVNLIRVVLIFGLFQSHGQTLDWQSLLLSLFWCSFIAVNATAHCKRKNVFNISFSISLSPQILKMLRGLVPQAGINSLIFSLNGTAGLPGSSLRTGFIL